MEEVVFVIVKESNMIITHFQNNMLLFNSNEVITLHSYPWGYKWNFQKNIP